MTASAARRPSPSSPSSPTLACTIKLFGRKGLRLLPSSRDILKRNGGGEGLRGEAVSREGGIPDPSGFRIASEYGDAIWHDTARGHVSCFLSNKNTQKADSLSRMKRYTVGLTKLATPLQVDWTREGRTLQNDCCFPQPPPVPVTCVKALDNARLK